MSVIREPFLFAPPALMHPKLSVDSGPGLFSIPAESNSNSNSLCRRLPAERTLNGGSDNVARLAHLTVYTDEQGRIVDENSVAWHSI